MNRRSFFRNMGCAALAAPAAMLLPQESVPANDIVASAWRHQVDAYAAQVKVEQARVAAQLAAAAIGRLRWNCVGAAEGGLA